MHENLFLTLAAAAVSVGSIHSLAPDHWVPFTALSRAQGWSAPRTARVTFLCGFGHVTVSALLGLLALLLGRGLLVALGRRMEALAGLLLAGFGLVYGAWGLRRVTGKRLHGHSHAHYDHVHDPSRATAWSLFLLFSADPCVAVIPLLFAAAPLGAGPCTTIVVLYEVATIGTMVLLVLPARAGAARLRLSWLDHWGDVVAGGVIIITGLAVTALGI